MHKRPGAKPRSTPPRCRAVAPGLAALPLAVLLLAVLLLGTGCAQLNMRDANDPNRPGATFRYLGLREGASSPDYSGIDATVLRGEAAAEPDRGKGGGAAP